MIKNSLGSTVSQTTPLTTCSAVYLRNLLLHWLLVLIYRPQKAERLSQLS